MKNGLIVAGAAFAVALAYVVGSRMSNEAIAVIVGAICGISASIPVSIALVIASSNHWGRREEPSESYYDPSPRRYVPQPPVIIMSSPQPQMPSGYPQNPYYFPAQSAQPSVEPREFKIIGGE
ncbi:MAG: hypothetical protein HZB51_00385 [Chloroflexi bacterium]|nr:hypothetical protein [Chloroflexota bacterium]